MIVYIPGKVGYAAVLHLEILLSWRIKMLGIIILNYETWDASIACIKSIVTSKTGEDYRIYLVDNASRTKMPKEMEACIKAHKICCLRAEENRGYAAGNNIGIRQALEDGCGYFLITNNDIVYRKDTISQMLGFIRSHSGAGIVGPKVVGTDGRWQPSAVSVKTDMRHIFRLYTAAKVCFRKTWRKYFREQEDENTAARVYHVSGCCFLMDKKTAEYLYPLDENTFLYNEELIIGIRLEEAGITTYYVPDAVVRHEHGLSTGRVKPFMYQCISTSEIYYCKRYLSAPDWQVWLLMQYRKLLYRMRMRKDAALREYWESYKQGVDLSFKRWRGT